MRTMLIAAVLAVTCASAAHSAQLPKVFEGNWRAEISGTIPSATPQNDKQLLRGSCTKDASYVAIQRNGKFWMHEIGQCNYTTTTTARQGSYVLVMHCDGKGGLISFNGKPIPNKLTEWANSGKQVIATVYLEDGVLFVAFHESEMK
jgi:hypothetical protein